MDNMNNVRGKLVWIVGGATGIGFAAARLLGRNGARIVLSGRRESELRKASAELSSVGVDVQIQPCDVASIDEVEHAAQHIQQAAGAPDIVVHAAGINVPKRNWETLDARTFSTVINVNLTGVANIVSTVLPLMRKNGGGSIAIVSSWAGWRYASFTGPAYSASKQALSPLVESINEQEARNRIRATLICPGEVATPILINRPVPPSSQDLERMLQPEDVADAIGFAVTAPSHVCLNEMVISPLWNRIYLETERLKG